VKGHSRVVHFVHDKDPASEENAGIASKPLSANDLASNLFCSGGWKSLIQGKSNGLNWYIFFSGWVVKKSTQDSGGEETTSTDGNYEIRFELGCYAFTGFAYELRALRDRHHCTKAGIRTACISL